MAQAMRAAPRRERAASRKDDVIQIRASAETKAILNRAALLRGQKLSEFMLESARRLAEETMLDQRTFFLDPKAHERFCTATRLAGTNTLTARYWDADKTIELFMTKAPSPATCNDLGPNKVLKQWDVPAANGASRTIRK